MAEQIYRYKAFISYRHTERDRKWARWLVEKLETFRTPRALVQTGVPARIGRLFRDDDEVPASSDLAHQIEDALRASQYLIVVCSPDTPASKWVSREIELFRSLGRGDHILALLVDGEPRDSFPENLLRIPIEHIAADGSRTTELVDAEPVAADVRPRPGESIRDTERRAFLRITAGLLGCTYDDLFRREHQRKLRRQRVVIAVASVLVTILAIGGYRWWDYSTPHTAYYADFGVRWMVPFGIGELSEKVVDHRRASYAITRQWGHVVAMLRLNGSHRSAPLSGDGFDSESWYRGVTEWRVHYQGDQVGAIDLVGPQGKLVRTEIYQFEAENNSANQGYRNAEGGAIVLDEDMFNIASFNRSGLDRPRSQIAASKIVFGRDGLIERRGFLTAFGQPAESSSGSYGQTYSYYPNGQLRSIRNFDESGQTRIDQAGIAEVERRYLPSGDLDSMTWRDATGRSAANAHGYAIWQTHRDSFGNVIKVEYSDSANKLTIAKNLNAALVTSKYDASGNQIEERYFSADGKPAIHPGGFSRMTWQYDGLARAVSERYFGIDGRPVLNKSGFSQMARRYDTHGNVVEENFYAGDGTAIIAKSAGYASIKQQFDPLTGKVDRVAYFGPNGKAMLGSDGYAVMIRIRADKGKDVADSESFFGIHGEPVAQTTSGAARIVRHYDQYGNVEREVYFDIDGKRTLHSGLGVAEMQAVYNDRGDIVEERYFDGEGAPTIRKDLGVAVIKRSVSEHGDWRDEKYFDIEGHPALRSDLKFAAMSSHYDDRGNRVEENYFGVDGKRLLRVDGIARVVWYYDAAGNEIAEDYFGIDGKTPVLSADLGVAKVETRFDTRGNPVEETNFGVNAAPIINKLGFYTLRRRYDERSDQIEEAYFGIDGRPIMRTDLRAAHIVWRYDTRGNLREEVFYGLDGRLTFSSKGFARRVLIYDEMYTLQSIQKYDATGRLISPK